MVHLRAEKIARIAKDIPDVEVIGDESGDLLVLGWGSTYGVITHRRAARPGAGQERLAAHLRYLNPLPDEPRRRARAASTRC